jgi:hypothetical protein
MTIAYSLEDHLGDPSPVACSMCGHVKHACIHKDVRDNPLIPHDFICGNCFVGWERECRAVWSQLNEPEVDWTHITERRRELLNSSMWSTATDGTVENQEAWLAWRKQVAAVGPQVFDHPRDVVWPVMPDTQ